MQKEQVPGYSHHFWEVLSSYAVIMTLLFTPGITSWEIDMVSFNGHGLVETIIWLIHKKILMPII
jgi:hypothetical protein